MEAGADKDIAVHLNPVGRDGADFLVFAEIEEKGMPRRLEQLWTRHLGGNRFEIRCVPFFAYDLSYGDEVETAPGKGKQYLIQRVVRPSGHYTFRVWFGGAPDPTMQPAVIRRLAEVGGVIERYSDNLVAVDAASPQLAQQVADALQEFAADGRAVFETGKLDQPR